METFYIMIMTAGGAALFIYLFGEYKQSKNDPGLIENISEKQTDLGIGFSEHSYNEILKQELWEIFHKKITSFDGEEEYDYEIMRREDFENALDELFMHMNKKGSNQDISDLLNKNIE